MKFTTVLLTSLAAVTAVSALPTPQAQGASALATRSDEDELFIRYADVLSYLDARGPGGSSGRNTHPLAPEGEAGGDKDIQTSLHGYHNGVQQDSLPGSLHHAHDIHSTGERNEADYSQNTKTPTTHNPRELFDQSGVVASRHLFRRRFGLGKLFHMSD